MLGAAGADGALLTGVAGIAALFLGTMLSVTEAEFDAV